METAWETGKSGVFSERWKQLGVDATVDLSVDATITPDISSGAIAAALTAVAFWHRTG